MEPAFVFALSVTTAIVGQFMKYVWSFKPARVPGSGTPSEPLPHTAHGVGASRRAPKRARETTAPRVSASVHAPNPALSNGSAVSLVPSVPKTAPPPPPQPRVQHAPPAPPTLPAIAAHVQTMLISFAFVAVALSARP